MEQLLCKENQDKSASFSSDQACGFEIYLQIILTYCTLAQAEDSLGALELNSIWKQNQPMLEHVQFWNKPSAIQLLMTIKFPGSFLY